MKRGIRKLSLQSERIRNLTSDQLSIVAGGAVKLSAPTDEMGDCGSCPSVNCTNILSCRLPPPPPPEG